MNGNGIYCYLNKQIKIKKKVNLMMTFGLSKYIQKYNSSKNNKTLSMFFIVQKIQLIIYL